MPKTVVRHEGQHLYAQQPRTQAGRRLSDSILRLLSAERRQAEQVQRASGLSAVDLTALRYLVQGYRDGRDLSPKDVIVMLDSSSATVTNVIERLVERDLVVRVQHPTDRRAHYLVPTQEAITRLDETLSAHHSVIVEAIDDVSDADAQTAADVIARVAGALEGIS